MKAREVVSKLGGRWNGSNGMALCPAHHDRKPSLSVKETSDGRILWHCHAGCGQEEVRNALIARGLLEAEVGSSLQAVGSKTLKINKTYDYHGPGGQLLFQVLRLRPKGFRQRRPDPKVGWIWNLKGVKPVPYRLPDLLQDRNRTVFVVEGEKDADSLAQLGLLATCNPGGVGKWREHYGSYFTAKQVIILPDNDDAGRQHAKAVATNLCAPADQVKIVELPNLPPKGDVSDWVAAGGTCAELLRMSDAAPAFQADAGNWYSNVQTGQRGHVLGNHANIMLALRNDDAWRGVFGYDEMRDQVMLLRPVPLAGPSPAPPALPYPVPWTDQNDAQAMEYLQLIGFPQIRKDIVATAIGQRAGELRYHPICDYLNGLQWDKLPRIQGGLSAEGDTLDPFLTMYFGAENTAYTQAVGTMTLASAVARIMDPGCKVDHVLILEGAQGIGKSTALRILASEAYFSDCLPEIGSKDALDHIRGKWCIEIAELDAMSRAEDTAFKAFVTRQVERFRPAFGRREIEWRRQCIFIGTTNKSVYLKDESGGRRYWPVSCESIDLGALERDRDQIWAEAVHLYRAGHSWHITNPDLLHQTRAEQQARYDADVWEEKVAKFVSEKDTVTIGDVMENALAIPTARQDRTGQNRVMKILRHLGWDRGGRVPGGRTAWVRKSLEP